MIEQREHVNVYLFIIRSNKDRLLVFGCYVFAIAVLLFLSKLVANIIIPT